jgi:hypothetical protein
MNSSQFQWAVVVFGMILGLSVTRILTSVVAAFRSRHNTRPDWVPLVWAACVFLLQLELWWAIADLRSIIKDWTFNLFLLFTFSPLLLFFAAALVLPLHEADADECHSDIFQRNGRWALIAISVYYLQSLLQTVYFWNESPHSAWMAINVALIVLPLVAFFTRRRVCAIATLLSFALTICFVFVDVAIPAPA